jgi:hypothetical protein
MIQGALSYVAVMGIALWGSWSFWDALSFWFFLNLGLFIYPYVIHKGLGR